jgi:transcriptional regulator with XRE-family HTH domain
MFRMIRGLTQQELGLLSGLPTSTIGGIESGARFPKILNLKKIADALEVDIAYLVSPNLADQLFEKVDISKGFIEYINKFLNTLQK